MPRVLFISSLFLEEETNFKISHVVYKLIKKEIEERIDNCGLSEEDLESIGVMFSSSKKVSKVEISFDENCTHSRCFYVKFPFIKIEDDQANTIHYTSLIVDTLSLIVVMVYSDIYVTNSLTGLRDKIMNEIRENFEKYRYIDPLKDIRK